MPTLSNAVQRALYEADKRWGRAYRRGRDLLGVSLPPRIVPYRGYGSRERSRVLARVIEDRGAPEWREGAPLAHTFLASYKRYATVEIPEAEVEVRWGASSYRAQTDEEGHLELVVSTPPGASGGWNDVELRLPGSAARAAGEVLVVPGSAEIAVVSDIDDTIIVTNVRHPLQRAATFFLTDSRVRLPFEGVAAFYRALHRGKNPIFYVSSSPWNLYEHLSVLFSKHDIPKGPMLLRDWGISREGFAPLGGHAHKQRKVNQLVSDHPALPFVLVGDSGQEDARHYVAVAEHHPGRVRVIYIRDVGLSRRADMAALADRARAHGTELVLIRDSVAAARHAAAIGLLDEGDVAEVAEDRRADEARPTPLEQALGD